MALRAAPVSIDSLRARKQDIRGENADLRVELKARADEARAFVASTQPHLNRLEMVATQVGPVALASVLGLRSLIERHGRQWTGDDAA